MVWKYFDFENEWERFHSIWQTDPIQEMLKPAMDWWCLNKSYYVPNEDGIMIKPTWKKGDDLWSYSPADFHHSQEVLNQTWDFINQHKLVKKFGDTLKRLGTPVVDKELLLDRFMDKPFGVIYDSFMPKAKSWRANVLFHGSDVLFHMQAAVAQIMYPDADIDIIEVAWENGYLGTYPVCKERGLLFDFIGAWHNDHDGVDRLDCFNPRQIEIKYYEQYYW